MKSLFWALFLLNSAFLWAGQGNECSSKEQRQVLKKEEKDLEIKLKEVLRREITAQIENEDPSLEKENARQIYFHLRKVRAEIQRVMESKCSSKP